LYTKNLEKIFIEIYRIKVKDKNYKDIFIN
jgi:hypothetical protein